MAFVAAFSLNVAVVAQKVTLNAQNVTVKQAIEQLQKSTGYSFVFSSADVNTSKVVSVNANQQDLSSVVRQILAGQQNLDFEIQGKQIIVHKAAATAKAAPGKTKRVSGRIVDQNGEPVSGASIRVHDGQTFTQTDMNGNFTIEAPENGMLDVRYIGYRPQTIKAEDGMSINLQEYSQDLEEAVVTALGIKRAQKSLSYNVQMVQADDVTANKDANFVNSLNGKVAGLNINASSGGAGSISKVVMRGTKSIMQSSNALYVIDGVPMYAGNNTGSTEFGSQGTTEPIADINPDDIESMSVLTGAAAAALYGSEAANGAIVITTKKGKEGRLSVNYSNATEFSTALVLPEFQNRYGTGSVLQPESTVMSWGRPLVASNNYGYQPRNDYFQTGVLEMNNVSLSGGNERNQVYASAAATTSKGIVPNNMYRRYNFNIRNTTSLLNDRLTLDLNASYIRQQDRNMINQGQYNNPIVGAYIFPRGNDWEDIQMYERWNPVRKINEQYWPVGDAGMVMQNPYWLNYRNPRTNKKDRYMLGANVSYKILDWLSVSGRVRLDNAENIYQEKFYATTNTQLTGLSDRGYYSEQRTQNKQIYADILFSINKQFNDDWNLSANFGGSYTDTRMDYLQVGGPIADGSATFGTDPVGLTNFFAVQNLSTSRLGKMNAGWHERTKSIYASAELGYKNTYFLTLTGRNDWPSQLAGPNSSSKSFFYPSAGLSVILSELMPNLNRDYLSYLKVRASYASVGNPFSRYIANPRYQWNSATQTWSTTTQYPIYNLKPERTNSFEAGFSARFFKNFTLDFTYYNAKTKNQTFNPQLSVSGYSALYIQTGSVRNHGIELSLGYKNTWNKFTWETGLTYSLNRNKILELADNAVNPATGERFSIDILNMGGLGTSRFLLKKGGSMGDLYSLTDLRRDSNGNIYVDENGKIVAEAITSPENYIKLGSVLPKGNLAWRNSFKYQNFDLSFLISARLGGVVFSRTQAMLDYYGVSEASAAARDLGYVTINGSDRIDPEAWYNTVAGGTAVPQYYTYSATNVRLQELNLGYTIPRAWLGNVCDIRVAFVGRNLFMIYNKAPFDPESVASTDNFYQGIDYFIMPSLRNLGFSINVKF